MTDFRIELCKKLNEAIADEKKGDEFYEDLKKMYPVVKDEISELQGDERKHVRTLKKLKVKFCTVPADPRDVGVPEVPSGVKPIPADVRDWKRSGRRREDYE